MKMSAWSLSCQQSVFQRYDSEQQLWEFYPQDGGESQLASKLRNCHPVYCYYDLVPAYVSYILSVSNLLRIYIFASIVAYFTTNWILGYRKLYKCLIHCVSKTSSLRTFATDYDFIITPNVIKNVIYFICDCSWFRILYWKSSTILDCLVFS